MGNYYNQTRANVGNQKPGLSHVGYIAPASWFLAMQQPGYGSGGAAEVTISTDHTFIASPTGLGFLKTYKLPKSVEVTGESTGDPGGMSGNWKVKFILPGDKPELQNLIQNKLMNDDLIYLALDANDNSGAIYQYGNERSPASIVSVKPMSGTKGGGTKGWEIEIEATERYFYTGDITVFSGTL